MKPRIIVCGSSHPAFELASAMADAGASIVGILPPRNANNPGAVRRAAMHEWPIIDPGSSVNAREVVANIEAARPDLLLNWGHEQRFGPDLLGVSRFGVLNLHPGEIPGARGREPVFHAMRLGWSQIIQTVHRMGEAYDDGPVIATRSISLADEPYRDTVEERLRDGAVTFYRDAALAVLNGFEGRKPTGEDRYFGRLQYSDRILDWSREARDLMLQIRALSPFESCIAQRTDGRCIHVWRAEMMKEPQRVEPAGTVLAADDHTAVVACRRGVLMISQLSLGEGPALRIGEVLTA